MTFEPAWLSADESTALLRLTDAGPRATDLVQAWVTSGNAVAVVVATTSTDASVRKSAKRGLNVLKARGVAVPELRLESKAEVAAEEADEAWMLPPDPTGSVMLVLTRNVGPSRLQAAFVALHDQLGVHRVQLETVNPAQLRQAMQKALPVPELRPARVDPAWARARIARARETQKKLGRIEPMGLHSAKALLEPAPTEVLPHPIEREGLTMELAEAQELSQRSGFLHQWPEFQAWFPPGPVVNELLQAVGQHLTPGETPDPQNLQTLVEQEIGNMTDRFFSDLQREQLTGWLRDSALCVLARAGEERAREVAAVWVVMANCGLITNPPRDVPFLRAFFDKAIAYLIHQGGGQLHIPVGPRPAEAAVEATA